MCIRDRPLAAQTEVGVIQVKYDGSPVFSAPLVTNAAYPEGGWLSRLLDSLQRLVF